MRNLASARSSKVSGVWEEGAGLLQRKGWAWPDRKSGVGGCVAERPVAGVSASCSALCAGSRPRSKPGPSSYTSGETAVATLLAAMHDAFEPVPILEKLPLQIDCLAAWGEPRGRGGVSAESVLIFHKARNVDRRLAVWTRIGRYPRGTG